MLTGFKFAAARNPTPQSLKPNSVTTFIRQIIPSLKINRKLPIHQVKKQE